MRHPGLGVFAISPILACAALAGCVRVAPTATVHDVEIVAKLVAGKVCPLRVEPPTGSCSADAATDPEDLCVAPGDIVHFQLVDEGKSNRPRRFALAFERKSPLGWPYGTLFGCSTSSSKGSLRCKVRDVTGAFTYAVRVDEGCGADPRIVVNPKR